MTSKVLENSSGDKVTPIVPVRLLLVTLDSSPHMSPYWYMYSDTIMYASNWRVVRAATQFEAAVFELFRGGI